MPNLKTATIDEIRQEAARICREYLTGKWKTVTPDQIIVKRISGGLSNFLYYVSLPDEGPSQGLGSDDASIAIVDDDDSNNAHGNSNNNNNNNNKVKRPRTDSEGDNSMLVNASHQGSFLQQQLQPRMQTEPKEVLLRVYGQTHGEDALEGMITESVVFALLSERNFGPKLHGIFPEGRIEQYIPARPLATVELSDPRISQKIAEKMGEIHSLNIPISKEPEWLWNCMDRWLKSLDAVMQGKNCKGYESHLQFVQCFDFSEEAKWLKSTIDKGNYKVFFCHNDLQEGNILLRQTSEVETPTTEDNSASGLRSNFDDSALAGMDDSVMDNDEDKRRTPKSLNNNALDLDSTRDSALSVDSSGIMSSSPEPELKIIDFEYCAYNYRGFDLANHFLEWTFDYSNPEQPLYYHHKHQYPTKEQRINFIVTYLKKLYENVEGYEPTAAEIEGVECEVRIFSMFSHLFWSLWSVVNTTSNIEFGYWEYAVARIREYQLLKEEYLDSVQD